MKRCIVFNPKETFRPGDLVKLANPAELHDFQVVGDMPVVQLWNAGDNPYAVALGPSYRIPALMGLFVIDVAFKVEAIIVDDRPEFSAASDVKFEFKAVDDNGQVVGYGGGE